MDDTGRLATIAREEPTRKQVNFGMRVPLLIRLILALVLTFVGFAWLTQLCAQVYSNSLVFIGCTIASSFICLWGAAEKEQPKQVRWFWGVTAALLLIAICCVAAKLPESYRYQKSFNTNSMKKFNDVAKAIGAK